MNYKISSPLLFNKYRKNIVVAKSSSNNIFPKSFIDNINFLNEKDKILSHENMKKELIKFYPSDYKSILEGIDNHDIISELDYIRVIYKKPISPESKIILRKKILDFIKISSEKDMMFFEYILKYYECL